MDSCPMETRQNPWRKCGNMNSWRLCLSEETAPLKTVNILKQKSEPSSAYFGNYKYRNTAGLEPDEPPVIICSAFMLILLFVLILNVYVYLVS